MPSVGGLSFDVMHGLPQSFIAKEQINAVKVACLSIGMKSPESPSADGGEIETEVKKTDESTCVQFAESCRNVVGSIVTIEIDTGASVPGQFVSGVECAWRLVKGLGGSNNYIFSAKWQLVPLDPARESGEDPTSLAEVWTAKIWGQWTREYKLSCFGAAEGLGSYAGEADIVQRIGTVNGVAENEVDCMGKWVEIRARTAPGRVAKPCWWGVVTSKTLTKTHVGADMTFHCVGLVDVLRQIQLNRWYDLVNGTTVADPGSILPFNATPMGDATSASTFELEAGGDADFTVHNRARTGGTSAWTALKMVTTALAAVPVQYQGGPQFVLSGLTDALEYQFTGNLEFANVFDMLQAAANPSRSIFFNVSVPLSGLPLASGPIVNIEICTGLLNAVNIPGQGNPAPLAIVIPQAQRIKNVDITDDNITSWDVSQDDSDLVDFIFIQAPRPLHCATLGFSYEDVDSAASETVTAHSQLTKDWSGAQETAWAAANKINRNKPELNHVWRRFRLKALWSGSAYSTGAAARPPLPIARHMTPTGNETGQWGTTNSQWPDARTIKLSRSLPIPAGNDWSGVSDVTLVDHKKPPEKIQVFSVRNSEWKPLHDIYEISVYGNGSAIEIGRDPKDADEIRQLLKTGYDIVCILGYEWPLPWRVSWRRSPSTLTGISVLTPRDLARSVIIPLSGEMNTWRHIDKHCAISVTNLTVNTLPAGLDVYQPGSIYQALEMAKIRYTTPQRAISWTLTGELDLTTEMRPGVLIHTANVAIGDRSNRLLPVSAVLTRRSWSFLAASLRTSYAAIPTLPEVDSVINMGVNANGPNGGGAFPKGSP